MKMKQIVRSAALIGSIGLGLVAVQACSDKSADTSVQTEVSTHDADTTPPMQQAAKDAADKLAAKRIAEKLASERAVVEKAAEVAALKDAAAQRVAEEKSIEQAAAKAAEQQRTASKLAAQEAAKIADAKAKKEAKAKLAAEAAAIKLAQVQAAEVQAAEVQAAKDLAAQELAAQEQAAEKLRLAAIEAAKNKAAMTPPPAPILASAQKMVGDAKAGALVFKKCRVCHSNIAGKRKVGPSLYGVVGRTPGTLTGYKYSTAMKTFGASGAVWDTNTLSEYLTSPRTMLPKIKMIFPGLKDQQDRLDIIAYLDALDAN